MYLETLQRSAKDRTVRVLLMGAGEYGLSFLAQSCRTPGLVVSAVYARREERGVAAFRHAGLPEDTIRICGNLAAAQAALAAGKVVVSNDALMLMQLPLDIVVESTGAPEAAAVHADAALTAREARRHGVEGARLCRWAALPPQGQSGGTRLHAGGRGPAQSADAARGVGAGPRAGDSLRRQDQRVRLRVRLCHEAGDEPGQGRRRRGGGRPLGVRRAGCEARAPGAGRRADGDPPAYGPGPGGDGARGQCHGTGPGCADLPRAHRTHTGDRGRARPDRDGWNSPRDGAGGRGQLAPASG